MFTLAFILPATIAMLAMHPGESAAYTVNVLNQTQLGGEGVWVNVRWDWENYKQHEPYDHSGWLSHGQSFSITYGGLEAGVCLDDLAWKINKELPGCESGSFSGKWHMFKDSLVCRSLNFFS